MVVIVSPPSCTCSKIRISIMPFALDEELNITNFIKSGPLIRCLFNVPCEEMARRCEESSAVTHPSTSGSLERERHVCDGLSCG